MPDPLAGLGETVPRTCADAQGRARPQRQFQKSRLFGRSPGLGEASGRTGDTDPLFAAGASLALLDAYLRRDPLAAGAPALTPGAHERRGRGQNPAPQRRRVGSPRFAATAEPLPAAKLLQLWRDLAGRSPSLDARRLGAAVDLLDCSVAAPDALVKRLAEAARQLTRSRSRPSCADDRPRRGAYSTASWRLAPAESFLATDLPALRPMTAAAPTATRERRTARSRPTRPAADCALVGMDAAGRNRDLRLRSPRPPGNPRPTGRRLSVRRSHRRPRALAARAGPMILFRSRGIPAQIKTRFAPAIRAVHPDRRGECRIWQCGSRAKSSLPAVQSAPRPPVSVNENGRHSASVMDLVVRPPRGRSITSLFSPSSSRNRAMGLHVELSVDQNLLSRPPACASGWNRPLESPSMPCGHSGCRGFSRPESGGASIQRPPDFSTLMIPLIFRRSSTRALPRVSVANAIRSSKIARP